MIYYKSNAIKHYTKKVRVIIMKNTFVAYAVVIREHDKECILISEDSKYCIFDTREEAEECFQEEAVDIGIYEHASIEKFTFSAV